MGEREGGGERKGGEGGWEGALLRLERRMNLLEGGKGGDGGRVGRGRGGEREGGEGRRGSGRGRREGGRERGREGEGGRERGRRGREGGVGRGGMFNSNDTTIFK